MPVENLLNFFLALFLLSHGLQWLRRYRSQQAWRQCTQRLGHTLAAITPLSPFSPSLIDDQFEIRHPVFPLGDRRRSDVLYWISQVLFTVGCVGAGAGVSILITTVMKGGAISMPILLGIAAATVVGFGAGVPLARASHACCPLSEHSPVTNIKSGKRGSLLRRLNDSPVHAYHCDLLKRIGFKPLGIHQRKNVGPLSTYRQTSVLETLLLMDGTTLVQMGLRDANCPVFFVQIFSQLTNHQTAKTEVELKTLYQFPEPDDSQWLLSALARHQASVLKQCQTHQCQIALIHQQTFEYVVQNEELQSRVPSSSLPSESPADPLQGSSPLLLPAKTSHVGECVL